MIEAAANTRGANGGPGDGELRSSSPYGQPQADGAADYMARYVSEVHLQNFHRKEDPILLRLEEKKRLRALVDAAWHALDFLPPPSPCPVRDSIRDPKGDLRRALDDLHDYLDEVQEEYPKA